MNDFSNHLRRIASRGYTTDSDNQELFDCADEIERLCKCKNDLQARIDWLITTYSSYDEDGIFTFPDGEYWEVNRGL